MPTTEPLIDLKELATILGVCPTTAWKLARNGTLPGVRIGKQWRFRRADVDRFVESNVAAAGQGGGQ